MHFIAHRAAEEQGETIGSIGQLGGRFCFRWRGVEPVGTDLKALLVGATGLSACSGRGLGDVIFEPGLSHGSFHLLDLAHHAWNAEVVSARQGSAFAILVVALATYQADLIAQLG